MQINKADFDIATLDDEIRVDGLCRGLIMSFYESLIEEGLDPAAATLLANGADHFVRDFLVGVRQLNLFDGQRGVVRRFAGNWYIVNTLEPSIDYLASALPGVAAFYRFLLRQGLLADDYCAALEQECADLPYYESRIATFWEIAGDGYYAWDAACPISGDDS